MRSCRFCNGTEFRRPVGRICRTCENGQASRKYFEDHEERKALSRIYAERHRRKVGMRIRSEMDGESSPTWKGEQVTYSGAHMRLKAERGSAADRNCVDCGQVAGHWSYNHSCPSERADEKCGPYSPDPGQCDPRCVPCHKNFDLGRLSTLGK